MSGPGREDDTDPAPARSPEVASSPASQRTRAGGPDMAPRLPVGFEATGAPLGAGGTAVVWPVRRALDGREIAVKVWRRPFASHQERERFRREVQRHVALNRVSGHVVTYAWAEEDPSDGTPWIGTEQHGTSLADLLEQRRPPLREAFVLGSDVLQGLADMHGHGALHRDVKPANVLVDGGRAKICDLGLVMDAAAYTDDNAAGTPMYVAPELLAGTAGPSERTDVYSAARTLRELFGRDVPAVLDQLLTAAASVNPADRPQDAGRFAAAYRRVCAELKHPLPPPLPAAPSPGMRPDPVDRRRGRSASRRRVVARGTGATAIILAATGAVLLPDWDGVRGGGPREQVHRTPDAGRAEADITTDGRAVILGTTTAGRCADAVPGAEMVRERAYDVAGEVVAEVWIYYSVDEREGCAKLVKPQGSPHVGVESHLAITLCGDGDYCDHDWNSYAIDAGPVMVPSQDGCLSYRVSMLDDTGNDWLIRDDVGWVGCSWS